MNETHAERPASESRHSPAATRRGQGRVVLGCVIAAAVATILFFAVYAVLVYAGRG